MFITMGKTKTMADRILQLRTEYGLNVNEFAIRAKLSHVAIMNLESGKVKAPQKETLAALCKIYGTTNQWLLNGVGEMLPNGQVQLAELDTSVDQDYVKLLESKHYNDVIKERDSLRVELERVWFLFNQNIGGKIPGFRKAINGTGSRSLSFPGMRFEESLIAPMIH